MVCRARLTFIKNPFLQGPSNTLGSYRLPENTFQQQASKRTSSSDFSLQWKKYSGFCSGLVGNRVKFIRSSSYSSMSGYLLKRVLIGQGWFHYCWAVLARHPDLFCFSHIQHMHMLPHQWADGAHKRLGGTQLDKWPQVTKGISCPNKTAENQDLWAKGRRRYGIMMLFFPSPSSKWWSMSFLEVAEYPPTCGKKSINLLFCLACARTFCFTYKTLLTLTFQIVSLSLLRGVSDLVKSQNNLICKDLW